MRAHIAQGDAQRLAPAADVPLRGRAVRSDQRVAGDNPSRATLSAGVTDLQSIQAKRDAAGTTRIQRDRLAFTIANRSVTQGVSAHFPKVVRFRAATAAEVGLTSGANEFTRQAREFSFRQVSAGAGVPRRLLDEGDAAATLVRGRIVQAHQTTTVADPEPATGDTAGVTGLPWKIRAPATRVSARGIADRHVIAGTHNRAFYAAGDTGLAFEKIRGSAAATGVGALVLAKQCIRAGAAPEAALIVTRGSKVLRQRRTSATIVFDDRDIAGWNAQLIANDDRRLAALFTHASDFGSFDAVSARVQLKAITHRHSSRCVARVGAARTFTRLVWEFGRGDHTTTSAHVALTGENTVDDVVRTGGTTRPKVAITRATRPANLDLNLAARSTLIQLAVSSALHRLTVCCAAPATTAYAARAAECLGQSRAATAFVQSRTAIARGAQGGFQVESTCPHTCATVI
jgi:hypothetical protein